VILGVFGQEPTKEYTPMALDESALPELLAALRAGDGVDLIRDAVRLVMQELIELEATEVIGAKRYERTDTRTNERNGHRPRMWTTQAGDIELKIPKVATAASSRACWPRAGVSIRRYTR
jgi:putative transposase